MSYTQNRLYACICSLFIPVNSLSGSPIAGTCEGTHPQSTVKESRELAPSDDLPSPETNYIQFQSNCAPKRPQIRNKSQNTPKRM